MSEIITELPPAPQVVGPALSPVAFLPETPPVPAAEPGALSRLCANPTCRKPLVRHQKFKQGKWRFVEKPANFKLRKSCNIHCHNAAHPPPRCAGKEMPQRSFGEKACLVCGEKFQRHKRVSWRDWNNAKYCSPRCKQATFKGRAMRDRAEAKHGPAGRPIPTHNLTGFRKINAEDWNRQVNRPSTEVKFPGATDIDAYLAMGGTITTCPVRYLAPVNNALVNTMPRRVRGG